MDDFLTRLSRLSPVKRVFFEKKLRESRTSSSHAPGLSRRSVSGSAPLSFAQEGLWFFDQFSAHKTLYSRPFAVRLDGFLSKAALWKGMDEIVRRHEVLRTAFVEDNGRPVQIVTPFEPVDIRLRDLEGMPAVSREEAVLKEVMDELQRPFDLAKAPLIRVTLIRLDEKEHILLIVTPHIVFDGWSSGVFFGELSSLYEAFLEGRSPFLPELPVQYADFAVWQRQWLQGEVLEAQLSYWRKKLEGAPPLLELPADRPRPPMQSYRGAVMSFELSKELSESLRALSLGEGVTLYMLLLAAFKTLLCRYTHTEDILVGTLVANRTTVESERLIGFFANTLVLRTDLSGAPTFREALHRVRETTLGAYAHQDLPFEKLVEELQPERALSHSPLFQVMFVLQNTVPGLRLRGLTTAAVDIYTGTAKFDLALSMGEGERGLNGSFEYNTDLFERETIERIAGHFERLLEGIVAHTERQITQLPILTARERREILIEWNETEAEYPREKCVHELFEEQVGRTPHAVAVVFEGKELTYEELNVRANKVAHYLVCHGVGPEVMVGIFMERSLEMVIGLVAILKAGGAYMPLDPDYPAARLEFMMRETGAPVVLTQEHLVSLLPETGAKVVCLDSAWATMEKERGEDPRSGTAAENLVYVIYTSGSTGLPKAVGVVHRGVVRLVKTAHYTEFSSGEVILHFSPITFDGATFKMWGCLLNGGRLVLFPPHKPSLEELGRAIRESGVTTLWLVSPLFHQMVEGEIESFGKVKRLLVGGDVLSVTHVRRFLQRHPQCRLINGYGPTENTALSCWYCLPEGGLPGSFVPIGRPVANTQAYILDAHREPVPVGVAGELYVGGDGLARGYIHRPELSAEKFIPNPFARAHGSRLYRTGDRARYLADGNIEFLGRLDEQVKIRGFRIECGEIEHRLQEHPDIGEAVVIAEEMGRGGRELVAYVAGGQGLRISDLRKYLGESLPAHMIPSLFTFLEALPRTPNGKIDRRALPATTFHEQGSREEFVPPDNPVEETIARIWAELLKNERVGRHDNFFALGGHSLLAVQVVSRIAEAFRVKVSLRHFFEWPTVSGLAAMIEVLRHPGHGEYRRDEGGFVGGKI